MNDKTIEISIRIIRSVRTEKELFMQKRLFIKNNENHTIHSIQKIFTDRFQRKFYIQFKKDSLLFIMNILIHHENFE